MNTNASRGRDLSQSKSPALNAKSINNLHGTDSAAINCVRSTERGGAVRSLYRPIYSLSYAIYLSSSQTLDFVCFLRLFSQSPLERFPENNSTNVDVSHLLYCTTYTFIPFIKLGIRVISCEWVVPARATFPLV